jgi:hypothetical protein
MDVTFTPFAAFYCSVIVLIGSFFTINLILAVLIQGFKKIQEKEEKMEQEKLLKDQN